MAERPRYGSLDGGLDASAARREEATSTDVLEAENAQLRAALESPATTREVLAVTHSGARPHG